MLTKLESYSVIVCKGFIRVKIFIFYEVLLFLQIINPYVYH